MKELLLFQVGNRQFGLDLPLVRSIHGARAFFEEQPEDGDSQVPMVRFQFEDMPLYDLSALLGGALSRQKMQWGTDAPSPVPRPNDSDDPEHQKVMLVAVQGRLVALRVDRIERVVSVAGDQIEPLSPVFKGPALDWFPRVLRHDNQLILLLNPDGIRWDAARKTDALPDDLGELENILTRMVREEEMARFILHLSTKIMKQKVARKIGKVEKILRKRLAEEEQRHAK